jgi:hypothetical protein
LKKKLLVGVSVMGFIILISIIITLDRNNDKQTIWLEPKAIYNEYKIYDMVEQKKLPCDMAVEILDSDETYDYYFNCLKSATIYFVSDKETINVNEAYDRGIITKEKLYELRIVDRMVRSNAK